MAMPKVEYAIFVEIFLRKPHVMTTLLLNAISTPISKQTLKGLKLCIAKAHKYAHEQGVQFDDWLQLQFAPDMFPLVRQIQITCDHAKWMAANLSGTQAPVHSDTEVSFAQLVERIDAVLAFIDAVPEEAFIGAEERTVVVGKGKPWERSFDGRTYLLHFALPNFYFHATTAYDLLRQKGVPLSKTDFLGVSS
jgi:hypothetical protein